MPLIETTGSASAKALGLNSASGPVNYIEDVFSTYLYVGNGTGQTINNGIDESGKGALTWIKGRATAYDNYLFDTARGNGAWLISNTTAAQNVNTSTMPDFASNGFTLKTNSGTNASGQTYVSWTFRKQPKFFDVVTYTGNGVAGRTVAHNLGSVPGCIIVKQTSSANTWRVYHRSLGNTKGLALNETSAETTNTAYWNSTTPTSTEFTVGTNSATNENGQTFVAYLFAHDAGGFGLSGADNVISCGAYTGTSATQQINLGFEPQWILVKDRNAAATEWIIIDNMRGMSTSSAGANVDKALRANSNIAEYDSSDFGATATGFIPGGDVNNNGNSYIYIAIRRGPMKTPTSGSTVYGNNITSSSSPEFAFPVDVVVNSNRGGSTYMNWWADRLRGSGKLLVSSETTAESAANYIVFNQGGYQNTFGNGWGVPSYINWGMRRAPGFMDVVCYTGTGVAGQTFAHNLGVVPELMIVKKRSSADQWNVYHSLFGGTKYLQLNSTAAVVTQDNIWNNTNPTASVFSVGVSGSVNTSGGTYVAYLFASCPGVSKVGSYSGTGATQTISCGFAVRFVLIKRTDSTGDWWVWDTTRGMVAGTDPRLALNLTSAETNANWVYTDASGFQIVTTDASVNASGGSYIFLAIA